MLKLYGHPLSGNAYKVKLMLAFLGLNYKNIDVALEQGEHLQPPFLALNPFAQIPVLIDGEHVLADAQAILVYLARQYGSEQADSWLPIEPLPMAAVMKWLSAADGKIDLSLNPHVVAWISRVKQLPNFVPMSGI